MDVSKLSSSISESKFVEFFATKVGENEGDSQRLVKFFKEWVGKGINSFVRNDERLHRKESGSFEKPFYPLHLYIPGREGHGGEFGENLHQFFPGFTHVEKESLGIALNALHQEFIETSDKSSETYFYKNRLMHLEGLIESVRGSIDNIL